MSFCSSDDSYQSPDKCEAGTQPDQRRRQREAKILKAINQSINQASKQTNKRTNKQPCHAGSRDASSQSL